MINFILGTLISCMSISLLAFVTVINVRLNLLLVKITVSSI